MKPVTCAVFFLVLLVGDVLAEDLFELLILHNNDMHARFEETARNSGTCNQKTSKTRKSAEKRCVGGFARTAHEIRRYRKLAEDGRGRPVLFLNAGDTYVGTSWFGVHKWKIVADFLNVLKPDAMSLGNHEFDNGVEGLTPMVEAATFPIIAANLNFDKEPSLQTIKKSVVLDIGGHKVGIIGHLTPETKLISQPGLVEFLDVIESVKAESEALDIDGVKIIIVVGHSGYEIDKQIAAEVPLVDVVVGGHTNTFLWNGLQPDIENPEDLYPKVITQPGGKRVPVVQAYAYTKYLGRLNVTFDSNGDLVNFEGQPELLETNIPQDQDVIELLNKYRPEIDALSKKVIGKSRTLLDATSNKCRVVECNFGNLVADSFINYMVPLTTGSGWTDTPIALVNGGGVRTTIDPSTSGGNVTRGEILGAVPFGNQIISLKLTGADLIETLEIGARSNGETSKGEFLQVSGLHVVYDMNKPAYHRVVSVEARCGNCKVPIYEPVVPDQLYDIVTVSFMVNGGDGHHVLRDRSLFKRVQDHNDIDVIELYFNSKSPVYPEEQGRIKFVEKEEAVPDSAASLNRFPVILVILVQIANLLKF